MGRSSLVFAFFAPLFLVNSCSKPTVIVSREYRHVPGDRMTLVVAPFLVTIWNTYDLADDWEEGDPSSVYRKFACPLLVEKLQQNSNLQRVVMAPQDPPPRLERLQDDATAVPPTMQWRRLSGIEPLDIPESRSRNFVDSPGNRDLIDDLLDPGQVSPAREVSKGDSTLPVRLPPDGTVLRFDSMHADFVLFLDVFDVYYFGKARPHGPEIFMPTAYTGMYLVHQAHFAFWDNHRGRLVAYGTARFKETIDMDLYERSWENGILGFAREILRKTPFYHPPPFADSW